MKKIIKLLCFLPLFLLMFGCDAEDIKTYDEETQCVIRGEAATMASGGATVYIDDGYKQFTGLGIYDKNSIVTLTIDSLPGYIFWGLYLDGKLVTEEQTYTFKAEVDEYIFKAFYKKNFNYINIICDGNRGEVFGDGEYFVGDEVTIYAEPFLGYRFGEWILNNRKTLSNENPYSFKKEEEITEIMASFVIDIGMYSFDFIGTKDKCEITRVSNDRATDITVPNYVTGINANAFSELEFLEEVTIGSGLKKIEKETFLNCVNLKTIVFSNTIEEIDSNAFDGCTNLEKVFFNGTIDDWDYIIVADGNDDLIDATIYYYSETAPTEAGNYWHYVDYVPTIWA